MNEKYRIHQVILAAPGTRIMVAHTEWEWHPEPVLMFGLVEDVANGGDRFVIPLTQWTTGVFTHIMDASCYGDVLAPGQEPSKNHSQTGRDL
jgi:hypothetical protein